MNALTDDGDLSFDKAVESGQRAAMALSPETLWHFGFDAFAKALRESFAVFPLLVAVILLSSVIGIYSENLGSGSRLAEFACLLGVCTIVVNAAVPVLTAVSGFLEEYAAFMTASNAAASLLMASSGNVGSGAAAASASAFTLGILQILAARIVFPCVKTVLAFGFLSALSKTLDLSGFIGFIRNFCTWGLGVLFGGVRRHPSRVHPHGGRCRQCGGARHPLYGGAAHSDCRKYAQRMLSDGARRGKRVKDRFRRTRDSVSFVFGHTDAVHGACVQICRFVGVVLLQTHGNATIHVVFGKCRRALNILIAICVFAAANGMILFASCTETALTL